MSQEAACAGGSHEWVPHGSYRVQGGRRRRVRCKHCGVAPNASRRDGARKRPQKVNRFDYWDRVLEVFPTLHLTAALATATRRMGVSAGLQSRLIAEVDSDEVELPAWPDERHRVLRRCLHLYRRNVPAPRRQRPDGKTRRLGADASRACWSALAEARGVASLWWTARRKAFNPTDPATGLPEAIPCFLDVFAPDVDRWRRFYPPSHCPASLEPARAFADTVEVLSPGVWRGVEARAWLRRWRSEEGVRRVQSFMSHYSGAAPAATKHLLKSDPPPVEDQERVWAAIERALERLVGDGGCSLRARDAELDRSLRYRLELRRYTVRAYVCTRRRIVGWAWAPHDFDKQSQGVVELEPLLESDEAYLDPAGSFSLPENGFYMERLSARHSVSERRT